MPYLSKRDTATLEDRWVFFSSGCLTWYLFLSGPPDDEWEYKDVLAGNRPDEEALEVYEVTDKDARFLIDTFTDEADESDLLEWLEDRCLYDEGTIGQAIDACLRVIDGFDPHQTNTILCALLAHFGVEE